MINKLISISRFNKKLILGLIDFIVLVMAMLLSFSIRLGYFYFPEKDLAFFIIFSPLIAVIFFIYFDLYQSITRYIGVDFLWKIFKAISLYSLVWGTLIFLLSTSGIPRSVIIINWLLAIVIITSIRLSAKWILNNLSFNDAINVVIYGAGSAGRQLSIALEASSEYNPVAFIDDNYEFQGTSIGGLKVINLDEFEKIINNKNVTQVLLAIPSISNQRRSEIINALEFFPVLVRSLPGVAELALGNVKIADLREVSIKDLLGRPSVSVNKELLDLNINNKVVLITGAGGSIGSELSKQILLLKPKTLILYELSELALYKIEQILSKFKNFNVEIHPLLGSITDVNHLEYVIKFHNVQTIYHAAAYKHVPIVEFNNTEGARNNILGTLNCAKLSIKHGVETFVLISTDKAVRPTNIMGATKRFSEMILQALTLEQSLNAKLLDKKTAKSIPAKVKTTFSIVRFGNVLGSSGSVIPLFKEQIKSGGPLTVTHPEILRYFMSISEAVELVIQAGALGKGGEVFVLDMGEPVLILELAKKMIRLSGLEVRDNLNKTGDIEIEFSGLRPGEKLYEELLIGGDASRTENEKILVAKEGMLTWNELSPIIDELVIAINKFEHNKVTKLLMMAVPEFISQSDSLDTHNN